MKIRAKKESIKSRVLSLQKESENTFIYIESVPNLDPVKKVKLDKTGIKKRAKACIKKFISTLSAYPHIDLSNIYRNFHYGSIVENAVKGEDNKNESGFYDYINREIIIFKDHNLEDVLYHELMHMASSHTESDFFAMCGFDRITGNYTIGQGLNEGYTEKLTVRYFDSERSDKKYYSDLIVFADTLELLCGKENMEAFYFKGDLDGFIKSIKPYMSYVDTLKLLRKMDFYYKLIYRERTKMNHLYIDRVSKVIYGSILLTLAKLLIKCIDIKTTEEDLEYVNRCLEILGKIRMLGLEYYNEEQRNEMNEILDEYNKKLEPEPIKIV